MKLFILDASVAVKWYLPRETEDLVDHALELLASYKRRGIALAAPDLLWAEFGNVMWKAVRSGRMSERDARIACQDMRAWELKIFDSQDLLESALTVALAHRRTFYDSLYVALAVQSKTELITADERLVTALGSRFPVRWLGSFSIT